MTKPVIRLASIALLTAVSLLPAWGQAADGSNRVSLTGTLGQTQIGMTLHLKDMNAIESGHYFYSKYLKDIPLTGKLQGSVVTLQEPEGGTFTLHFKGNGSEAGKPLDFNNSVGLEGTWTKSATTLPVKLGISGMSESPVNARWYESVTGESDAAFEAKVQGFYQAVLSGDRAAAAQYTAFPLRINHSGKSRLVRSAVQLSTEWPQIFTPAYLAALKKAMPHDLFTRNGQAMLGDGIAWFGAKGVEAINVP